MDSDLVKLAAETAVTVAGAMAAAYIPLGAEWLRQHLKLANETNQSTSELNANRIIQNAVHNAAGQIVLDIASGKLDITKPASIAKAALEAAGAVAGKVPDSVAKFGVGPDDIAQMIVGKVGHSVGIPSTPNTATDAKAENAVPKATYTPAPSLVALLTSGSINPGTANLIDGGAT